MPYNLSGLDALIDNFDEMCRNAVDIAAREGEATAKDGTWSDDTVSLRDSITGFEALTGDPWRNLGASQWSGARSGRVQSKWGNDPSNYDPATESRDLGEADHPVGVIAAMVDYALSPSFSGSMEVPEAVIRALLDGLDRMEDVLAAAFGEADSGRTMYDVNLP